MTGMTEAPDEITLTSDTVAALMADPALMDELDEVREQHGRAAMVEWLDAHGLAWRAGGSTPEAAFASGGFDMSFDDPTVLDDIFGDALFAGSPDQQAEARHADRRRAARKAQKRARKAGRRR
jgi:hypothetical protein